MIRKFINSFRDFKNRYPYAVVIGLIFLLLFVSSTYYRVLNSNPKYQYLRIGVEQGLSVDSVYKLKMQKEGKGCE